MWSNEHFFRSLLDNLYDGVYFVDHDRKITYWNRGAERLSGFSEEEVIGSSCKNNILCHVDAKGNLLCMGGCPLAATLKDGKERQTEVYLHHRDGHRVPVNVRVSPIRDQQEKIVGAVEIFSDNTRRNADQEKIEELRQLAFLDPLTALANRRYLEVTLRSRLEELVRFEWGFSVLFIDIDHFKEVNDRHGHETGDEALKMVAKSMAGCCRVFDMVGRWGGEEFIAIIMNVTKEDIHATADRFRRVIEHSALNVAGERLRLTVSIGATEARADDTAETIIKRADALMYRSKQSGRNCVTSDK